MMASSHGGNSDTEDSEQQHTVSLYEVKLTAKKMKVQLVAESPTLQLDVS